MKTKEILDTNININVDSRIESMLDCVISSLDSNHKSDYSKIILTMLVPQLILYFRALDEVNNSDKLSTKDDYSRTAKSPEIQVLQKCNDQILNLLDKLCLSPLEKSKLKRLNKDDGSAKELLDALIN